MSFHCVVACFRDSRRSYLDLPLSILAVVRSEFPGGMKRVVVLKAGPVATYRIVMLISER